MTHAVGKRAVSSQRFKQLGHCVSSPGQRCYDYAELAVFLARVAIAIAIVLITPTQGCQAELAWVAGLNTKIVYPRSPIPVY